VLNSEKKSAIETLWLKKALREEKRGAGTEKSQRNEKQISAEVEAEK